MDWKDVQQDYQRKGLAQAVGFGEKPAVVVVDFIKSFTDPASALGANFDAEVEATARLLAVARRKRVPTVFTTVAYDPNFREAGVFVKKLPALKLLVKGSEAVEVDPRLGKEPDEHLLVKSYASAFFGTALGSLLVSQGVDTVIVTGCTTSGCVRATAVDSMQCGFRTIVPRQCVGDRAEMPHEANLFDINAKYGDVVDLDEVLGYLNSL